MKPLLVEFYRPLEKTPQYTTQGIFVMFKDNTGLATTWQRLAAAEQQDAVAWWAYMPKGGDYERLYKPLALAKWIGNHL